MVCEVFPGVSDLHDLERAVWRVQELDLADAPLRHGVERRAAPAPLQQADGLRCKTESSSNLRYVPTIKLWVCVAVMPKCGLTSRSMNKRQL